MATARVLIVDDDRDLAESFADYLDLDGHAVDVVFSGGAGVEAALGSDYDQIIIDVGLPDIDGAETARRILRERPEARIFLITGYSASDPAAAGVVEEGIEVLTKPVDPGRLSALVAAAVDGR